nr:hypothetical protein [Tanacetum cinerariifolium]
MITGRSSRIRRTLKDGCEGTCFQLSQRFIAACSYPTIKYKDIMKAQVHVSDYRYSDTTIENADLKAQIQEKNFANAALKNELRKSKGNSIGRNALIRDLIDFGVAQILSLLGKKVEAIPNSAWIEKYQIDNFLKERRKIHTLADYPIKEILLKLNLPDHRSILMDSHVTPTKRKRMTKPYSSLRFIANCFNAGYLKMEVK